MKINQKQFERYKTIHSHLSKKQGKTWEELSERCATELMLDNPPSRRTIMLDLSYLRSLGAEIRCKKGYYSYSKPFSLFGVLNTDELELANEIKALFSQYAQLPQISGLEEVHIKIEEKVRIGENQSTKIIVNFEQNFNYLGQKHLMVLYNAIKGEKALKICYEDFNQLNTTFSFSPYFLKEYNNRWHLYGYEHQVLKIKNIALDRISKIEDSLFKYRKQKNGELSFLDNVLGFTRLYNHQNESYQSLEIIKIKVLKPRASYIVTKPIHQSQQIVWQESNDEYLVFTYKLMKNNELVAELLSYGKDLTVLSPLDLRDEIGEIIKGMNALYN